MRLKLFELLAKGSQPAIDIARSLNLPLDSAERLLEAAVSLSLVEKRTGGRFGLGQLGAALLGNPGVGAMIEHHRLLYADLSDPVRLLRREHAHTELANYWAYARAAAPAALPDAKTADYTALMASSQSLVAAEILDAYSLREHRCLLDIGGGNGGFLIAAAERFAHLKLLLFDLPAVARVASRRFASVGLSARAEAVGGDFFKDELPKGADVVSLVRVLHDHDEAAASTLLRAAHRALPPHGVLLLAEPMTGTPGAEPVGDAYFGFYLLAMGSGKARCPQHLQHMLRAAGFAHTHLLPNRQPLQSRIIVAHKAGVRE